MEVIHLLSSHWDQFDRRVYLNDPSADLLHSKVEFDIQSTQLSELISNLLGWIQSEKHARLRTRALDMLTDISHSVIGTLTILSNPDFCYAINAIMNDTMKELSLGSQQPFVLEKLKQTLGLTKQLYDQWRSHATANQTNEDIKITLFANLLGPFKTCIELGQACQEVLKSSENSMDEATELLKPLCELLHWLLEVTQSLHLESNSGSYRFDERFDGIEACFVGLEGIFQTRKRSLADFLKSRDWTSSPIWEDFVYHDDYEEMFYFSKEVQDFKVYAHRMFPGFSSRKRVKVYEEESDEEGAPVIIPFEPHHVSTLAREEPHRKNLGGGKAYQNNEFRNPYGVRKANAARLPSVHVDDFLKKPHHEPFHAPVSLPMSNQPPDNFNPLAHSYEHPNFRPLDTSPQSNPRGRMNPANPRPSSVGMNNWPPEGRQYRPGPGPGYPDPLLANPMRGPPLNEFEMNRRGAFQRFPNGIPPGPGVPSPYYNPHFYQGVPPNQGYAYERPFFPGAAPNQFFDPNHQPRPRYPINPSHMEFREQMEPGNPRFRPGPNLRSNGTGRTM
ncbi:hypothetical protein K7432_010132 [Basidiobolus ranarum]|uniref:Uncharacterized protein n=1 Tax=Basidiobolus ranarum TaxID=34480 RepID=A0ABR2VWE8_9FUNG